MKETRDSRLYVHKANHFLFDPRRRVSNRSMAGCPCSLDFQVPGELLTSTTGALCSPFSRI